MGLYGPMAGYPDIWPGIPPTEPPAPTPGPIKPDKRRPFETAYLWTCNCTSKDDRLQPVPGIVNPTSNPLGSTGPGTGKHQVYPFPSVPPIAVGTGDTGTCVALIVKCPGKVAVYHFTVGDDVSGTLGTE